MKLTQSHIAKIDPLLQDELMRAEGDEALRVIMALGSEEIQQGNFGSPTLNRADFSSSQAYRQALVEQRQHQLARELGGTTTAIENLSLKIQGGVTSPIVVVEGTARQILNSLELPGVRSASLDRKIELIEITPTETDREIADIALEVFNKGRGKFQEWFGKGIAQQIEPSIVRAIQKYIHKYHNEYGKLQVLGMRESVSLETVYTSIKLQYNKEGLRTFSSLEDLKKAFHNKGEHGFWSNVVAKQPGLETANEIQYLTVLGAPGSGKTVFLRKIGLEALKGKQGKFKDSCIPVLLELRKFDQSPIDFPKIIAKEFRNCGFPNAEEFTQKALEQGRLLVLLDGVDEVSSQNLDRATETIQNFVDRYKQNRYIISCRTAARLDFLGFTNVEIAPFGLEQISQFINNWFHSAEDQRRGTDRECWRALQMPEHAAARELAQTPLLLTFLCLVYDHSQNFVKNRSELYYKALRLLLEEWAAEKRTWRDAIFNKLKTNIEETLLSEIAFKTFRTNWLFFYKSELIDQIEAFLRENRNAPQGLSGEAVLNAIAVQQGILMERAEDVYSFSHLTLQEYLAAYYVHRNRTEQLLVEEHFWDGRWREVFLLVAGFLPSADELLIQMNKKIGKAATEPKLNALLEWAVQRTAHSAGDTKPMVKRANVLLFALNYARIQASDRGITQSIDRALFFARSFAYTRDLPHDLALAQELTRALDLAVARARSTKLARDRTLAGELKQTINRALDLASDLYKALDRDRRIRVARALKPARERNLGSLPYQAEMFAGPNLSTLTARLEELQSHFPDTEQEPKVYQKFAIRFGQICLELFKLSQTLLNLSQTEARKIEIYFYANELMVKCSDAPVGGSHEIWQEIEAQMLLPTAGTNGQTSNET